MTTLQLGQFQPTLQSEWSTTQLVGLVNLSLLFSDTILLHDTQLLDNPHILETFRKQRAPYAGVTIYRQIREGIRAGLIEVGLRDGMLIRPDEFLNCNALEDVAGAWITQRMTGVGRVREDLPFRADVVELARDLDWTIQQAPRRPAGYSYVQVKKIFQDRIRESVATANSPINLELDDLPYEFVSKYNTIVDRPWFSHTDLFHLVKDYAPAHDLMMLQGFTDESAYSSYFSVDLCGSDRTNSDFSRSAERLFTPEVRSHTVPQRPVEHPPTIEGLIEEHAARILAGPGVGALALLEMGDILELRALGADTRALRARIVDGVITHDSEDLILGAFDDYWRSICRHIKKRFPMSTRRPSRLLILLRRKYPRTADIFVRGTRFGHLIAPDVVRALPSPSTIAPALQVASSHVGLEFLLFAEDTALHTLRRTLPQSTWRVMVSGASQSAGDSAS